MKDAEYAGLAVRFGAGIIDITLLVLVTIPLSVLIYGMSYFTTKTHGFGIWIGIPDFIINAMIPCILTIVLWTLFQRTPGKLALSCRIVDADTMGKASFGKYVLRYIGYIISIIPLGLGIIWVAFDKRNQGWHDKIAGTVVIQEMDLE